MAQYRFLQYIVDPFIAWRRVTVAALIKDQNYGVRAIMAPKTRVQQELGWDRAESLLAELELDIRALVSFDHLPRSFGPQFLLTSPEKIPGTEKNPGMDDALLWVHARLAEEPSSS